MLGGSGETGGLANPEISEIEVVQKEKHMGRIKQADRKCFVGWLCLYNLGLGMGYWSKGRLMLSIGLVVS